MKKGTHLASEELHQRSEQAKAFALTLVGASIGFLIFYQGVLLLISDLTRIPPSGVMLGGGFLLMVVALVLGKYGMRRLDEGSGTPVSGAVKGTGDIFHRA